MDAGSAEWPGESDDWRSLEGENDASTWQSEDEEDELEWSDEAILAELVQKKRTDAAGELVELLARDVCDVAEWLPLLWKIRALPGSGELSDDERLFLVSELLEPLEYRMAEDDPRAQELLGKIRAYRDSYYREHGVSLEDDNAPEEYQQWDEEWGDLCEQAFYRWLEALGEDEMATLRRDHRLEYERRVDLGRRSLVGGRARLLRETGGEGYLDPRG